MNRQALFNKFDNGTPWLRGNTIFLTRHGSHAYGTNIPGSDEDFKGLAIPPPEYFLGYSRKFEQAVGQGPDITIYDIRKFFALAADCNPSIIEVLFTDPSDHVINRARELLDNRDLFLSKKAKFTFSGYAMSQLKRIETHRRWLLSPPEKEPKRADFGLTEMRAVAKEQLGAAEAAIRQELDLQVGMPAFDLQADAAKKLGYEENFIEYLRREQNYRRAKQEWTQYNTWKRERNKSRAELERKFGYDTKHAMHLVRLMRMGAEILTAGAVIVRRPDAEELLSIRYGAWKYDDLMQWAKDMDTRLNELYKISNVLPKSPDIAKLDALCMRFVEEWCSP